MDNRSTNSTIPSATDESTRLLRQIDAGARAAEVIERIKASSTVVPSSSKRSAPSLRTDINFTQTEDLGHATIDERYRSGRGPYGDKMLQETTRPNEAKRNATVKSLSETTRRAENTPVPREYFPTTNNPRGARGRILRPMTRGVLNGDLLPSTVLGATTVVSRARASFINTAAFSWGIPVWFFGQFIFGLISVVSIGMLVGVETVTTNTGGITGLITSALASAANTALKIIGVDLSGIAVGLFGISYMISLATGLFIVLILGLQYKLGLLHPIFGTGSTLKISALILTVAGLGLPILNLIPFVALWMTAVWLFPR